MNDILIEILTVAAGGGIVATLVEVLKIYFPNIKPKTVAIVLSGVLATALYGFGFLPEDIKDNIVLAIATIWASSITIYEVLKQREPL